MARICLNILVGIPASGKTTYCQQIAAFPNRTFKVVHVCYDTYIEIDGRFDDFCSEAGSYKMRRQTLLSSVEAIICAIKEGDSVTLNDLLSSWKQDFEHPLEISSCSVATEDYLFLIDDNNYYRSMRWDWARMARKFSLGFFETYFAISLQIALERNDKRKDPVSGDAIARMWTRLEKPCKELFPWEQNANYIQGRLDKASIFAKINQCLANPEKFSETPSSVASPSMEQSDVHKLDILLRKAISKKMSLAKDSMAKEELKSYVDILQERKKFILEQMRQGEQNVPGELLPALVEKLF
uniref:Uncharacterized protein n=1 Tax=Anopheles atroparvus TaxID=41427 RepID=A0A182JBX4_ANOAO